MTTQLINKREIETRGCGYKERALLYQMREELCDFKWRCEAEELFDASKKLKELHSYHETLLKVQSDKLTKSDLAPFSGNGD